MKFLQLLLLLNVLTCNALALKTSPNNTFPAPENTDLDTPKDTLKILFEKGIQEYSHYKYKDAITTWNAILKEADPKKDSLLIIKTNINLGSSYNALGYHKSALTYFLKTSKNFEDHHVDSEQYWINNLNIGVCNMSLEQYDIAKHYFVKTKDFNPYIVFLKKLNIAKWYGLNNQQSKFIAYQDELAKRVADFPMYIDIWNEMQLEFFIKWEDRNKVQELLNQLSPSYKQQNLFIKLLLNQAHLFLFNRPLVSVSDIQSYASQVQSSGDLYLTGLYYIVLKEHYFKIKDIENYHKYSDLYNSNNEALFKEKNMLHVEDFKVSQELEELKGELSEVRLKNEMIQLQLAKSKMRFQLSIVIIIMGLGIIFLIIRNHKKNKKLLLLTNVNAQNDLLKNELEKMALSESLKEKSEELNSSIVNIKKVALLKKQLENIINSSETQDEKEILRNIKICLNSFFDNYRELTEMMQKKLHIDKLIYFLKNKHPELSQKEIQVVEYIALQFTTKEIALLMSKAEKSIEYYRTQIRKKMSLSPNQTLEAYINYLLKLIL